MKGKLLGFPTVPKDKRISERAKILSKNFSDPVYGVPLMIFLTSEIYNVFSSDEADWLECQILAKAYELEQYLLMYHANVGEDE
jgi:hypothetical protein